MLSSFPFARADEFNIGTQTAAPQSITKCIGIVTDYNISPSLHTLINNYYIKSYDEPSTSIHFEAYIGSFKFCNLKIFIYLSCHIKQEPKFKVLASLMNISIITIYLM